MAKLTDKFFNRVIEGKLVAESGDELPKELPAVSGSDNGKALIVSGGKWQAGAVSSGTKLYKHSLILAGIDEENNEFTSAVDLISYVNEQYALNKDISQSHIIKVQTCDLPNGNVCYPFIILYSHGAQEFNITGIDEEGTFVNAFWTLSSITDTVTEL